MISKSKNVVTGGFRNIEGNIHIGDIYYNENNEEIIDYYKTLPEIPSEIGIPQEPYIGLNWYKRSEARVFFGRGRILSQLHSIIENEHGDDIILLYGQSGVGKSSLLHAGFIPRIESKWKNSYHRVTTIDELSQLLEKKLEELQQKTKYDQIIIIDQFEEILAHTSLTDFDELFEWLNELFDSQCRVKLIFSFRKEYVSEIELAFTDRQLNFTKLFITPLGKQDIIEIISGVTNDPNLNSKYQLSIDKGLPEIIANEVLRDEESHIAPTLQLLMTKLWEAAKENNSSKPEITLELYKERIENNGIFLNEFIHEQIEILYEQNNDWVKSGLVFSVLEEFISDLKTSRSRSRSDIQERFSHVQGLDSLLNSLIDLFLLTENSISSDEQDKLRLAHDSLGPILTRMIADSSSPGPTANRILESKYGLNKINENNLLSSAEIKLIESGQNGMRKWTIQEVGLIQESKRSIQIKEQELRELREKEIKTKKARRRLINITIGVFISACLIIFSFWLYQDRLNSAKEKTQNSFNLAALANTQLNIDPNKAMENADKALSFDNNPSSLGAFYEAYYRDNFLYLGNWYSSPFYTNIDLVEEKGEEIYVARFTPDQKYLVTSSTEYPISINVLKPDGTLLRNLSGHEDELTDIVFSMDKMISTGWDGKIIIWNISGNPTNWKIQKAIEEPGNQIESIAVSNDGLRIIVGNNDRRANIYTIDGSLVNSIEHDETVNSVNFSSDDSKILTSSGNIVYLRTREGVLLDSLVGHEGEIDHVEFSPDQKLILTASHDNTIKVWDLDGEMIKTIGNHQDMVRVARFSPDGNYIVSGSNDNKIKIWEKKGRFLTELSGHKEVIYDCSFSPDGASIISASGDGSVKAWNLLQKPITHIKTNFINNGKITGEDIHEAYFTSDEKILIFKEGDKIKVFDFENNKSKILENFSKVSSIDYLNKSNNLLLATNEGIMEYNFQDEHLTKILANDSLLISRIRYSKSNKDKLLFFHSNKLTALDSKGNLRIVTELESRIEDVISLSNGSYICLSSEFLTSEITLIDIEGNLSVIDSKEYGKQVESIAISPNEDELLLGTFDGYIQTLKLDGKAKATNLIIEDEPYNHVTFSPDGNYILTSSHDGTSKMWDKNGIFISSFGGSSLEEFLDVNISIFSPQMKYIFTNSYDSKIWLLDIYELKNKIKNMGITKNIVHLADHAKNEDGSNK